jgi:hypothetical protein
MGFLFAWLRLMMVEVRHRCHQNIIDFPTGVSFGEQGRQKRLGKRNLIVVLDAGMEEFNFLMSLK